MSDPDQKPPWRIPYRWFWVLGGVMVSIAVIAAVRGVGFLAIVHLLNGVMMIILGFGGRRGAPPV